MKRLIRADRENLDNLKTVTWNFMFNLLDEEFGGQLAGLIASKAVDSLEEVLVPELEVEVPGYVHIPQ